MNIRNIIIISMLPLSLSAHSKQNFGNSSSSAAPLATSAEASAICGSVIKNQIQESRAFKVNFDGAYGSTPVKLFSADDGFCFIERIDKALCILA